MRKNNKSKLCNEGDCAMLQYLHSITQLQKQIYSYILFQAPRSPLQIFSLMKGAKVPLSITSGMISTWRRLLPTRKRL